MAMKLLVLLPVLLLSLLAAPAAGASLRRRDAAAVAVAEDPAKPKDIHEKYDKLDDFLGVMFTMACKWKHGKDVHGLAKEKLKDGEVKGADGYMAFVKDSQAKNVQKLESACGMIVARDKKKCREGCAKRWNAVTGKRDECDEKCESRYSSFERSCMSKADNLVKVYEQKSAKQEAQKQCFEGHCKEFPMVWMKADEAAQKKAVEDTCKDMCTDKNIKAGCQKQWALEADMIGAEVASDCAEKSGVKKCFDKEQKTVSGDYDKCKTKFEGDCKKAFDECKTKGKVDKTFKDAKAFCDDRKKMCEKQGNKNCLDENKAGLKKAEDKCKQEAGKEFDSCQEKALDKKEKDAEKKCIADRGPKCKGECKGKCEVAKMNKCLAALKTEDPGKVFCKDFWRLLHSATEVDPVTGDPVEVLSA